MLSFLKMNWNLECGIEQRLEILRVMDQALVLQKYIEKLCLFAIVNDPWPYIIIGNLFVFPTKRNGPAE